MGCEGAWDPWAGPHRPLGGTLPKARLEALGWEWQYPAGAPTLTPLLPQWTGLIVPYQHLYKLSREFEWTMTSLKGWGNCVINHVANHVSSPYL